jgi:hypothetical protein
MAINTFYSQCFSVEPTDLVVDADSFSTRLFHLIFSGEKTFLFPAKTSDFFRLVVAKTFDFLFSRRCARDDRHSNLMRKRDRSEDPSEHGSDELPTLCSGGTKSLIAPPPVDMSQDSQEPSTPVSAVAGFLSEDSNPVPIGMPQEEQNVCGDQLEPCCFNDGAVARDIRLHRGFVCCQWWARSLFEFALNCPTAEAWDFRVKAALSDPDAKAGVVTDLVSRTASELIKIAQGAGQDEAARLRRSLRLLRGAGFCNETLAKLMSQQPHRHLLAFPHGPSYRLRKSAGPAAADPQRVGKMVIVSVPHHRHPEIVNTALVCAEPKKKKPSLDDSRIVSHPQRATLHGMEDLLLDEATSYSALLHLRRHLDRFKSLRGIPTSLNTALYHLVGKDEDSFEKLRTRTRQNPAAVRFTMRINPSIPVEQMLNERIRVVEASRRCVREAALSLSLLAARAHWRDVCLAAIKHMSMRHIGEWRSFAEVYNGAECFFPNAAASVCAYPAVNPWLRQVLATYSGSSLIGDVAVNIMLPMLCGQPVLPPSIADAGSPAPKSKMLTTEGSSSVSGSDSSGAGMLYVVPPCVVFALQGVAALLFVLNSAIVCHPEGDRFLVKFLRAVDPFDDPAVVKFLLEDQHSAQSAELAQLAAVSQALRTVSTLVEAMVTDDAAALDAMLRCHAEFRPRVGANSRKNDEIEVAVIWDADILRKGMIAAFEGSDALSDQLLVELVVKAPAGTHIRPLRLFEGD